MGSASKSGRGVLNDKETALSMEKGKEARVP